MKVLRVSGGTAASEVGAQGSVRSGVAGEPGSQEDASDGFPERYWFGFCLDVL